ncbi:MAG: hypothetical protein GYA39_08945 [Methanothrix sp.]|nr:hypothetical protein [Methanothrix sp.]
MPDSNEVERKIREILLDMGDDQLLAKLGGVLKGFDERDRRISDALEEMIEEVDRLLLKLDELEAEALDDEEYEL